VPRRIRPCVRSQKASPELPLRASTIFPHCFSLWRVMSSSVPGDRRSFERYPFLVSTSKLSAPLFPPLLMTSSPKPGVVTHRLRTLFFPPQMSTPELSFFPAPQKVIRCETKTGNTERLRTIVLPSPSLSPFINWRKVHESLYDSSYSSTNIPPFLLLYR